MKSPAHRTRDIERQAGYLKPEHCAPPPPRTGSDTMWFIRDGCGIVCGIITWLLVFYAEFVVVFVMLLPAKNVAYSLFNGVLFNGLAFLALASHARAMCTDPVSHVCKRCIKKMDHHCPWVNNCVGENNQKYFVLFTMYIALISFHALIMVAFHFVLCFEEDWTKCSNFSPPATVILLILLCFEGLLFLIFTAVMFGTQVHSICTDETGIEQLKKEERRWAKKSKWMNMKVVFGHPFSVAWLSPFATPDHGKADVYQYIV
ncbi:hypothetical protein INR49_027464 [Caranx melampygus]|nr:hypothetical protein INR49_027464 [Caranx melampygus]